MDQRKAKLINRYAVEFTQVPPIGSKKNVFGKVYGVDPFEYKIALYIYLPEHGWISKPYIAKPSIVIDSDGTWSSKYAHNSRELLATQIAAFLVHKDFNPPAVNPARSLPAGLFSNCLTHTQTNR